MFSDLIRSSGETRSAWAQRLGISKGYLSDLLNGKRVPSLEVAVAIQRATDGRIAADSWVPEVAAQSAIVEGDAA